MNRSFRKTVLSLASGLAVSVGCVGVVQAQSLTIALAAADNHLGVAGNRGD